MRLSPEVAGDDVAVIDARALFVALPLLEGGFAAFCRACGAELRLEGGLADMRAFRHAEGCPVPAQLGPLTKPAFLRYRAAERRH